MKKVEVSENNSNEANMATQKQKDYAWENASKIRGKNPELYRRDEHGNEIYKSSYGKTSEMGWEVDHRKPLAKGGSQHLNNIRALHHDANRKKSAKYPHR